MRLRPILSVLFAASLAFAQAPGDPASEPLRPQIHFSPRSHWMNDPNGLVFFAGEYHLFFQYNPFGDIPGHISWGHAVSPDLLHWSELPVAIPALPEELVFTGSVVVDTRNTSGLCLAGKPCMVAIYTAHRDEAPGKPRLETQALAVSQDRGRTWTRFSGNPVLDLHEPEFRDPSVSWSAETNSWLMAVSMPNAHQVLFFTSPDLKHWTRAGSFGSAGSTAGQWECPSLLHLPGRKGSPGAWALKIGMNPGAPQGGSGEQFFLGAFDGHIFTPSNQPGAYGWSDYGKDSYCTIPYNNLPATNPPTTIGWMDNWQYADQLPAAPFRGQMTLPRRLSVSQDSHGLALHQEPVVAPLRSGPGHAIRRAADDAAPLSIALPAELILTWPKTSTGPSTGILGIRLASDPTHYIEAGFDLASGQVFLDRTHAPYPGTPPPGFLARTSAPLDRNRPLDLHLILDRTSIELFAQDSTSVLTDLNLNGPQPLQLTTFTSPQTSSAPVTGTMYPLKSGLRTRSR